MSITSRFTPKTPVHSLRVGETLITRIGAKQFDWRDPYYAAIVLEWPVFLAVVILYYCVINAFFATLYYIIPGSIKGLDSFRYLDTFFFSVETFATVGYGAISPDNTYGHVIATIEIIVGLMSSAVITGLLFVRLSRPRPAVMFASAMVICSYNGIPTLMIRLANARPSAIFNAMAKVTFLKLERSQEGQEIFALKELKLVRDHSQSFALSWLLMHSISQDSPLYGITAENIQDIGTRIVVSISGHDEKLANSVFALHDYTMADVRFGSRYVDFMVRDETGITMDLQILSETVPDTTAGTF